MRFIETPIFTKELQSLLEDEEYRALQLALLFRPGQKVLIPGSGGLRKLRWSQKGKGTKSKQEDLTPTQMKVLTKLVKEELK